MFYNQDAISNSATHYQRLLDGYNKEVAGSTYREIKELITRVVTVGYFDWKPQPEVKEPEPIKEPEVETIRSEIHNQEVCSSSNFTPCAISRANLNRFLRRRCTAILPKNAHTSTLASSTWNNPLLYPPCHKSHSQPATFPSKSSKETCAIVPPTLSFNFLSCFINCRTDFNFIQESLIDHQPVLPMMPPTSVQMGIGGPAQTAVPVSLASMDSAVMMVHSQVPPAHLAAYSFLSGNPAAAASLYGSAPIVSAPSSTLPAPEQMAESARTASPVPPSATSSAGPADTSSQANTSAKAATTTTSSTWAEEPQEDMPPYQQEQNRTESNTWTNSNFRSNDQGLIACS